MEPIRFQPLSSIPRAFWPPWRAMVLIFVIILLAAGCDLKKEAVISGRTMGTTYHIKVVSGYFQNIEDLEKKIENRLEEINAGLSTYRRNSEISLFNAFQEKDIPFRVSSDFFNVMAVAADIHRMTNGAWDGTVMPLVDLWGFGPSLKKQKPPTKKEIAQRMDKVGFHEITLKTPNILIKSNPFLTLDLGAIAKGYGVDQIAALIKKSGIGDFIVEIGGEVYAAGRRKDGHPWRAGINTPDSKASPEHIYKIVRLHNRALATSGDYRNFFRLNGRRYSHVIDPKTGYPVSNGVVSVSIMAESCTLADGLATAIMVLGPEKGIALINRLEGVEGLIVVSGPDGAFKDYYSAGFADALL
jgi:thiamine biosynthesis lipoprotein